MALAKSFDDIQVVVRSLASPIYMIEKEEILEYYRDRYGTQWKQHIVSDLQAVTGLKRRSLMRRFQGVRTQQAPRSARARAEYVSLGEHLPPVRYDPPPGGIQVNFVGYVQISSECEERDFYEVARDTEAYSLVNAPSFGALMNLYFPANLVAGPCGPWSVEISAL